jgi:hypothetical protein
MGLGQHTVESLSFYSGSFRTLFIFLNKGINASVRPGKMVRV